MIFDIECDGLNPTRIYCLSYTSTLRNEIHTLTSYEDMRKHLLDQKVLIGHNIIRFDIPILERILGIKIQAQLIDTLSLSWYLKPERVSHGLASYGVDFGTPKPEIEDWDNLSIEEYSHRCEEDVKINKILWDDQRNHLIRLYGDMKDATRLIRYLSFKMDCAREAEENGWRLDIGLAEKTFKDMLLEEEGKVNDLEKVMPHVPVIVLVNRPSKPFKKDGSWSEHGTRWFTLLKERGLSEDHTEPLEVLKSYKEPNPGSSQQVKDWFYSLGWEPDTFKYVKNKEDGTERAIPQICVPDSGGELSFSVLKLAETTPSILLVGGLSMVQHRITVVKGFLENHVKGILRARISGLTNTLRFKHQELVNLPKVDRIWGKEVRNCLIATQSRILCGSDMVSLEDMTKRHYIYTYDPDYVKEMSKPGFDPHLDLAQFAKAVSKEDVAKHVAKELDLKPIRTVYKKANYACTYGIGAPKLARETGLTLPAARKLVSDYWSRNWAVKKVEEDCKIKYVDGVMWIFNPVSHFYYRLRAMKDRFSTLNQGTGVYCFDSWVREVRKSVHYLVGQFHDEIIEDIPNDVPREEIREILKEAIGRVNSSLKLNVLLDVDIKFGHSYADIH